MVRGIVSVVLCSYTRGRECARMRFDLRWFKVSRVSVGRLGSGGRGDESEGAVDGGREWRSVRR